MDIEKCNAELEIHKIILEILDDVQQDNLVTKQHALSFSVEFADSMSKNGYKIVKK